MKFNPDVISGDRSLISGDNKLVMQKLLEQGYLGKFDMIYFDGPFNSGLIFSTLNTELKFDFVSPWSELSSLQNFFDKKRYISEYRKRISLARDLLSDEGVFVLQTNLLEGHNVRVLLDEVFGRDNFLCEVIWKNSNTPMAKPDSNSQYGCQHETLYFYSKTENYIKRPDYVYPSVWDDIGGYSNLGDENTNFPSQKPEKLLERVIEMTSVEDSLIGDFYCGSGTFPLTAEKMKRKWVACDSTHNAIEITKHRLDNQGVEFNYHTLVDEFNPTFLNQNIYKKNSQLPLSVGEFLRLDEEMTLQSKVEVYSYSYDFEIDLLADKSKYSFHFIVPLITQEGISEEVKTSIPRPVPVKTEEGYRLNIKNPFEWVMYNIVHVERDFLGCIRVNKTDKRSTYIFNWGKILEHVDTVLKRVEGRWVKEVQTIKEYTILTDIFGNTYII